MKKFLFFFGSWFVILLLYGCTDPQYMLQSSIKPLESSVCGTWIIRLKSIQFCQSELNFYNIKMDEALAYKLEIRSDGTFKATHLPTIPAPFKKIVLKSGIGSWHLDQFYTWRIIFEFNDNISETYDFIGSKDKYISLNVGEDPDSPYQLIFEKEKK